MSSVFAKYQMQNYPHRYAGTLEVASIAGGVPMNPDIYEGHLKRRLAGGTNTALIAEEVLEMMADNEGMTREEAIAAQALKGLTAFRRDPKEGLYYPGAYLKAAIKEAAAIAAAAGRIQHKGWGMTSSNKGILSWLSEHVFVVEDRLYLGVDRDDGDHVKIETSFVHKMTPKGQISAIQNTEVVRDVEIHFTVETDHEFPEQDWAALWLTAERNGIGSARKMGYGLFTVTRWEKVAVPSVSAVRTAKRTTRRRRVA